MDGLDRIIDEIIKDAEDDAEKMIKKSEEAAERIIKTAQDSIAETEKEARVKAELEHKRIISRAESAGEILKKRKILKTKQELIMNILKTAQGQLARVSDKEYFDLMKKLLNKYSGKRKGTLIFSKKDKERITPQFKQEAEAMGFEISDKNGDISGGFILSYGDIEENCSIEALMEAENERLHDIVNNYLF